MKRYLLCAQNYKLRTPNFGPYNIIILNEVKVQRFECIIFHALLSDKKLINKNENGSAKKTKKKQEQHQCGNIRKRKSKIAQRNDS